MKQCKVCDFWFHPEYGAELFCSSPCRQAVDSCNGDIDRARKRYRERLYQEFCWQRFVLGKKPGEELIFR